MVRVLLMPGSPTKVGTLRRDVVLAQGRGSRPRQRDEVREEVPHSPHSARPYFVAELAAVLSRSLLQYNRKFEEVHIICISVQAV